MSGEIITIHMITTIEMHTYITGFQCMDLKIEQDEIAKCKNKTNTEKCNDMERDVEKVF
jgi:hypothetical protein